MIEAGNVGGTCVNTGCTPTKAYIAGAGRAWIARHSDELGLDLTGEVKVDFRKIKERKDQLVNESRENIEEQFNRSENISLIRGAAEFIGSHQVKIGRAHV